MYSRGDDDESRAASTPSHVWDLAPQYKDRRKTKKVHQMEHSMSPTPEGTARALKAWETIRRKRGENPKTDKGASTHKKWNVSDYSPDWKAVTASVRERAMTTRRRVRCECRGECLKHRGRCEEVHMTWPRARRRRGNVKIRITTAHLCHETKCDKRNHLRAMCEPCHLIYDLRCRQQGLRGIRAVKWAIQQGRKRLAP